MSSGSTGSTFPKWQLAVLIGAPVVFGLGYMYWRRSGELKDDDDTDLTKKKFLKDKTISIDGADDKSRRDDDVPFKPTLTPLQQAQEYKNQGNTVFKKARYDEAIELYDKAIEACPTTNISDLATFYQNRAAAYEQLKKYPSVIDDCTKAIELNPKYVKALHRRARAYETIQEYAKCLEDTTATCILEGFQNRSTLILADRVLKELGRKHAQEAMNNRKPVKPSKYFVKNYFASFSQDPLIKIAVKSENPTGFMKAKIHLEQGEYDEVIAACTEEIESSEAEAEYKMEATLLRATMFLLTGRFAEASIDLDAVISNNDASPAIRVNALIKRASLNMQTEKPEECFDDLNQAEKLDSTNGDIFHHRGQVFILLEQLEHALNDFTKACKLCPLSGVAWAHKRYAEYRIAFQTQNHTQILEVMADFMRTIEQFPKCVECYSLYAQALTDQQQFNEADNHFEKAIKVEPHNAQIQVHRALLVLQWKGDVNSAVSMIEKAIETDEKCEFAYETLGTIEVQRGNLEKAVSLFDNAITLAKSEMELVHLYSLRDAATAQINVTKKMGIDVHNLATMAAGMNM